MMRGVAALEGLMTHDSTPDNFLLSIFCQGVERYDFGCERPIMESEKPDLGSESLF